MIVDTQAVFTVEEVKGSLIAWLKTAQEGNTAHPLLYLTENGIAFLSGFTQAHNTIELIKKEKYDELLINFENLITKYDKNINDYNKICDELDKIDKPWYKFWKKKQSL